MKITKFESREAWLNGRLGKITGSRLKDVLPGRNGEIKKGRWQLVAERLIGSAALEDDEKAMDRGNRLEPEALTRFTKETGIKLDTSLVIWEREDDQSIAISPDGFKGKTIGAEAKCLNAASHIEARVTNKIPKNTAGYEEQSIQYFVVNDKLKTLYFIFYDPRFPKGLDFFYLTINRKDVQKQIDEYLWEQREALKWAREIVNNLTMYSPDEIRKADVVHKELIEEHQSDLERIHAGILARS